MLNRICIQHFRNIQSLDLTLSSGATWITGENAQGKTALLEAIYLLATGGHLRGSTLGHLVRQGDNFAKLSANFATHEAEWRIILDPISQRWQKEYFENGVERRFTKRQNTVSAVLFEPQDVRLFSGAPSRRRYWLDDLCGRLYGDYRRSLLRYERFLKSRNQLLLRSTQGQPIDLNLLEVITKQMASVAVLLWQRRHEVFGVLLPRYLLWLERLWGRPFACELSYQSSLGLQSLSTLQDRYQAQLTSQSIRERRLGRTLSGPHLDDIVPRREGVELAEYASRGELRCLAMALKLAEIDLITEKLEQAPLLLLDDVMSELDEQHRSLLEEIIQSHQTIITATSYNSEIVLPKQALFRIVAGVATAEAA